MRGFAALAVLWFLLPSALLAEKDDSGLLLSALPEAVAVVSGREVHYCPDNTCAVYKAEVEENPVHLLEFVFLHLFHVSDYLYLEEDLGQGAPFREAAQEVEPKVRARVERYCDESDKEPRCILAGLSESLDVTITTRRYDEGDMYES